MSGKRKRSREAYVPNKFDNRMKEKLLIAFGIILVALIALATYLGYINYKDGDKYSKLVLDNQTYDSSTLPFKRGDIRDRNGTVLAYSSKVYRLVLDPAVILADEKYKEPTLKALTQCFDLSWQDIEKVLSEKPGSHYEKPLKQQLTVEQVEEFTTLQDADFNIRGVWFEEEYIRTYPFGSLACDVIGFSSSASSGAIGLENYYNDELTGTDGVSYGYVNSDLNLEKTVKAAVDGRNIITTIDFTVQSIVEEHIKAFNEEFGSKNTAVIIMNPNNGEIIAEASYPVFDLNSPADLSGVYTEEELAVMDATAISTAKNALWRNFCVSDAYEPGSTIKPFTVATGLEEGFLFGNETFDCDGVEHVLDMNIKCHNIYGHGELTLEQTIMESCNDAMMQIAAVMGADMMGKYQDNFGFGYKTYIDLPGETSGLTVAAKDMDATDIATNSFGQNLTVNMHQMVAAFASLINGGYYYEPHLVKRIETNSGEVVSTIGTNLIRQTITSETSDALRKYMRSTVSDGTASRVAIDGYDIGGKTGTAEVWALDEQGRNLGYRSAYDYVISFMGFAPVDDPQFLIYVVIDSPQVEAGLIGKSLPVCNLSHDILVDILPYLNVFPDYTEDNTTGSGSSDYQVPTTTESSSSTGVTQSPQDEPTTAPTEAPTSSAN